jgi:hypothetical protein
MVAAMTLDEAIKILKGKPGSIEALGAEYVQHARAAEVIGRAHRTKDAASKRGKLMGRMKDQGPEVDPTSVTTAQRVRTTTEMGADPEGSVGPRRILRLDGPATAYSIVTDANGETWLCLSSDVEGVLDPGDTRGATFDHAAAQQRQQMMRRLDEARAKASRGVLAGINKANRAMWNGR